MVTSACRNILDCGILVHPGEDEFEGVDCRTVSSPWIIHVEDCVLGYGVGDTTREEHCEEICSKE